MPAKNLHRKDEEGIYSHIYNKGVEKRIIFNDKEDYEVFQGFLKDYLTAPQDPESIKKVFTVHGRIFRGTPHQPKNYFSKVELIAYSLMPDHFNLLLHHIIKGSLERFIRSLCTRYSMYFNKKYQRTGALFEGPYKSVQVSDKPRLLHLTRYLHHTGSYSSYPEYLGARVTSWVKPKVALSFFGKGTGAYKDFVEKYELDQKEKEFLEGIIFEDETQHLERRGLARNEEIHPDQDLKLHSRIPEFLAISAAVFLLLVTLGIGNIKLSEAKSYQSLPTTAVLGKAEEVITKPAATKEATSEAKPKEATSEAIPKTTVRVKINDGAASVNIRQKPTTNSEKIGKAKDGDTFEFVSVDSEWYGVKLVTGSTGFISAKYIKKGETNN